MGVTIGAMLEEIQSLYRQHHQPCFLYLSSEVIKVFIPYHAFFITISSNHMWPKLYTVIALVVPLLCMPNWH